MDSQNKVSSQDLLDLWESLPLAERTAKDVIKLWSLLSPFQKTSQALIEIWQSLDFAQKHDAIETLSSLCESSDLEKEIHTNSEKNGEIIAALPGKDTDVSWHCVCVGDFTKESCLSKIEKKKPIQLVFTSPPYNADIKYDIYNDKLEFGDYVSFLNKSWDSIDRVLEPGGRLVINLRDVAVNKGKRVPIIVPLYSYLCEKLEYDYRGVHIWYKGREESSFAWGSWLSSNNPSIIDLYEYVFVFQKQGEHSRGLDNMNKTEFLESVIGVWKIRPVKKVLGKQKRNIMNHPCPFPVELAKRVIKLYSHVGDTVLDPFAGVMSTARAAADCGRNSISVDISEAYCNFGIDKFIDYADFRLNRNLTLEKI